ncbi:membrane dipeptidase [Microbacterium oxydans]|uniref:dipeptidase n=1 Tax=Microbacterium TaxID=33882 RepID=UPI00187D2CF5|nr:MULTISPECIES: membrane dipeptidase [Microbacterium]MBE7956303.1 membrane dipeptidase [Microbacterium sp. R1]MCK8476406.1 dipeptidase [Microbacterium aurugineum]
MTEPIVGDPIIADAHNDLLLAVRHMRERGHPDPFGAEFLPQLRAGGVRLQVLPICTEEQFVGEGALRRAMVLLEEAYRLADEHADDVLLVRTKSELDDALTSGRIALILALEGAEPIGSGLELIDTFYRSGVRMASLSWNRRTMMADGVGESDTGGRLTALGVSAIALMEERGMVVDVSHLSRAGFDHFADIAQKPFIASHSSCATLQPHPRNLHDDQLLVMRDKQALLCLNAFGPFLSDRPDVDSYLDHVEHAVAVVGSSQVGMGTDFLLDVAKIVDPILSGLLVPIDDLPWVDGLSRPADFETFIPRLTQRVGTNVATAVAGENLVSFMRTALP